MDRTVTREVDDVPPLVRIERRHAPERRRGWRGGRRDADWKARPAGRWTRLRDGQASWLDWIGRLATIARNRN